MARIRADLVEGDLDADLTNDDSASDTEMSSPGLSDLPAVSSPDIAAIIVDKTEIIHVTDHAAGATTATVVRGQEDTSKTLHTSGTHWRHGPTEDEWVVENLDTDETDTSKVLKPDGSNGLAWGSASSSSSSIGAILTTGEYVGPVAAGLTDVRVTEARMTAVPLIVEGSASVDRIAINATVTGGTNEVFRLGIYQDAADGQPGALLVDAGTVDTASSAGIKEITIAETLSVGVNWLVAVAQGASGTTPGTIVVSDVVGWRMSTATSSELLSETGGVAFYKDSVTGALPDPFGAPDGVTDEGAVVALRGG